MSDESPDVLPLTPPAELPLGIVCRDTTRSGFACIRRWRVCANDQCGHEVRTKEVIEFDEPSADKAA